jgi:hypothetical protein
MVMEGSGVIAVTHALNDSMADVMELSDPPFPMEGVFNLTNRSCLAWMRVGKRIKRKMNMNAAFESGE